MSRVIWGVLFLFVLGEIAHARIHRSELNLVAVASPFTRTPHNPLGFSFSVGLSAYDYQQFNESWMIDAAIMVNIPYQSRRDEFTEWSLLVTSLWAIQRGIFIGITGGLSANFGSTPLPTIYGGPSGRWFPFHQLFCRRI